MNSARLRETVEDVKKGKLSIKEALKRLEHLTYEDISCAKIDHHRVKRQGVPEAVLAMGKQAADVLSIAKAMHRETGRFFITKAEKSLYDKLKRSFGKKAPAIKFHPRSGIIHMGAHRAAKGNVLVLSAGTSDIPIAEEAAVTAGFLGSRVISHYDVGVSGLHRLMDRKDDLHKARVVIVVAGMEGALPSVVGGMVDKPIVAVPTSQGYGTSMGGLTALFAMLNSCVPGIAVMNIDNGFGAGCLAHRINTI